MIIEEQHDSEVVCVTQFEALQKENAAQLAELTRRETEMGMVFGWVLGMATGASVMLMAILFYLGN